MCNKEELESGLDTPLNDKIKNLLKSTENTNVLSVNMSEVFDDNNCIKIQRGNITMYLTSSDFLTGKNAVQYLKKNLKVSKNGDWIK
jgi:hypothetical protein